MNARPQAWLLQALKGTLLELGQEPPHTHVLNDLVGNLSAQGVEVAAIAALPLKALTRMTISSRYPIDATPPSELFDRADPTKVITTADYTIAFLEQLIRACCLIN